MFLEFDIFNFNHNLFCFVNSSIFTLLSFIFVMTSFRFNFCKDDFNIETESAPKENIQWLDSSEVKPDYQIEKLDEIASHAQMFTTGEIEIGHVIPSKVIAHMKEQLTNELQAADDNHSDLITGKYEGGLKLWECTYDLIEYLLENIDITKWNNAKTLDLGCGAGLLGILAFLKGSLVTFQDYNKEVLEYVTIPNVLLNIEEEENRSVDIEKCKFYSGDWRSFDALLDTNVLFDYILTSETIYNPENYSKLIDVLCNRLEKSGTAFIAAKSHYFGVGGSVKEFEQTLKETDKFHTEICWKSKGGIQREIIKVTWK